MAISRDLFLAILAMDSYNRGYGGSINGLDESGNLGTATIRTFEDGEQEGWQDVGFYAIAYNWNGETIISYRGTDGTSDIWNGWTLGASIPRASQGAFSKGIL